MPWVPIHEAYPDGRYYVATGFDNEFVPIEDHPEFSIVDGVVVWERVADTDTDAPADGLMPSIVFALPAGTVVDKDVRATLEDLNVYTDGNNDPTLNAVTFNHEWMYIDGSVEMGAFVSAESTPYEWSFYFTGLYQIPEPSAISFSPPSPHLGVNGVEYQQGYFPG